MHAYRNASAFHSKHTHIRLVHKRVWKVSVSHTKKKRSNIITFLFSLVAHACFSLTHCSRDVAGCYTRRARYIGACFLALRAPHVRPVSELPVCCFFFRFSRRAPVVCNGARRRPQLRTVHGRRVRGRVSSGQRSVERPPVHADGDARHVRNPRVDARDRLDAPAGRRRSPRAQCDGLPR